MKIRLAGMKIMMMLERLDHGDLVLVTDTKSLYHDKLGVVCGTIDYCKDVETSDNPDCYTCDLVMVGDLKKVSVRAKFLKKV